MPSPQNSSVQSARHPSPVALFPSLHSSTSLLFTTPSPQNSTKQLELHPSPEASFPSSHSS
eukprot:3664959-Rhodomonas_salina.1